MKEINLYVCGSFIKAWKSEAITLSNELGYKVTNAYWAYGELLQCGFPNYVFEKNFKKLIEKGYKINFWYGKVQDYNLIGIFEELEDIQYIKYDQFSFVDSADTVLLNTEFDMSIICSNIGNGPQNEKIKENCLNVLAIFEEELQFLKYENNIEEYWKNKKQAIKKVAVTSKKATELISDLDSNLIYGNIDSHFEIFRRRILKARKFADFTDSDNIVRFYNLLYYGVENENSVKRTNLIARMLFCTVINDEYDEMLKLIFSSPQKLYSR